MRRLLTALVVALVLPGCIENDFKRPSEIFSHRVLALVADKPEVAPDERLRISALVVDPEGERITDPGMFEWKICLRVELVPGLSGMMFQDIETDEGCGGWPDLTVLGYPDGDEFVIPALPPIDDELLAMRAEMLGDDLPLEAIRMISEQIGFPIAIELTVRDPATGGELVRAFKRIILVERAERGTNPPGPRFWLGDSFVRQSGGTRAFECHTPGEDVLPQVRAGEELEVRPDPDDEWWRETFPVIDLEGDIVEAKEGAYYSFFSTEGVFADDVNSAPTRDTTWTAPREPGIWPLWLVVRDGHAGTAACRVDVEVTP